LVVITDTFTFIGKAKFSFLIVIKAVATHFVESFCFQDSLKEKKKKKNWFRSVILIHLCQNWEVKKEKY